MILDIHIQQQILDEWCWAAVASTIAFKYDPNSNWDQSNIAGSMIDEVCSNVTTENSTGAPDICHNGFSLAKTLKKCTHNYAWDVERPLTLNEVRYQINKGWPICAQIYWEDLQDGHFIIIYGYEDDSIKVGDPAEGQSYLVDYNTLLTNYRQGKWVHSYGTQSSLA